MCSFPVHLSRALGILLGAVATTMAHGQQTTIAAPRPEKAPPPGSVHRMVILEGANRRVHYITAGNLSTSDRVAAYDLERSENDLAYLHDLQQLKRQYVHSERIMEPRRRYVQEQLYGTQIRYGGYGMSYARYGGGGGYGYFGGYGYGGGGYGYGGGYGGSMFGSVGSSSYSVAHGTQFGMGDEGRMKSAMVQVIARDASTDSAAALRNYKATAARAAASPILSRDLSLPKSSASAPSGEPSFSKDSKVTIWAGNDKYVGTVKEDRPEWVVLQTDKGEVTVRKATITRSEVSPKP